MSKTLEYAELNTIDPEHWLRLLNKPKIRQHLIEHDVFDLNSVAVWVESKFEVDALDGCRVRAITLDGQLVGWCGIQCENELDDKEQYELAIVIDDQSWGIGRQVFMQLMQWARDFGHDSVVLHLLDSRPEYRFLRKQSSRVTKTELLGRQFTSYVLKVE